MIDTRKTTKREFLHAAGLAIAWISLAGFMSCGGDTEGTADSDTTIQCAACPMRARYDSNPKSLLSRLWKWHTSWCPGWRSYLASLQPDERKRVMERYK
jgi:hypothetical protein